MQSLILKVVFFFFRFGFSLRYKITFLGLEQFIRDAQSKTGPILFLSNHTSQLDPIILYAWLWPKFKMRALAVEYIYRLPIVGIFIRATRGIPIPNFDTAINQYKIHKAKLAMNEMRAAMENNENFLIFPAARTKLQAKEIIGGSSGAHELVQSLPNLKIGMVRISGLWGSSFSRALEKTIPDPLGTLAAGIKIAFKNFLFFTPRRRLFIELELDPPQIVRKGTRVEFNHSLEAWFNQYRDEKGNIYSEEPLKLVSYSPFKEVYPRIEVKSETASTNVDLNVSDDAKDTVYDAIRQILSSPNLKISPDLTLGPDLGMDSLNIAELIAFMSQRFGTEEIHPEQLTNVRSVLLLIAGVRKERIAAEKETAPKRTPEKNRPYPARHEGNTFPEVFLSLCSKMGPHIAIADETSGEITYKNCRRAALVLAQEFRKWPEKHIGIMLPSCAAVYLAILAVQLAGKIPVMLNWTLGSRYLEQMMEASRAKRIISSWRFIERLPYVEFGSLIDKFEFLEDIRQNLPFAIKLKGALLAKLPSAVVLKMLKLHLISEDDPAVILFTSGTENNPKGVPLSHKNILSDIRDSMLNFYPSVTPQDAMFGFLPPFHSFGFTASGFMPLFSGIRVICSPNPTDNPAIANGIEKWEATYTCSTPSFLKRLIQTTKSEKLKTLRWIFLGGEKAPQELHEKMAGISLIEGYGVTECSPIISVRKLDRSPHGVGQPLASIEISTIHPETQAPLAKGAEGEICVCGPMVFNGYLGNVASPFVEFNGKRWYRTGDIGRLDEQGTIHLTGRLKRFVKLGGEMISLGAVEETLIKELQQRGVISAELPSIAVCSEEGPAGAQLILFATIPIEKEKANEILKESGFSRLIKIGAVKQIQEIPLMGTGKTNYRSLQSLL